MKGGIVAVVVAHDRRELLARTLDGIAAQLRPPDSVLVIDNASVDGSGDFARLHPLAPRVVTLLSNYGGAGGFAAGIALAIADYHAELVWVMDDDTIPDPGALAALVRAREGYPGQVAVCASRAVWHDGREHPMNAPRERFAVCPRLRRHAEGVGAIQIRSASFVSILIDARAIRESGLPVADYFLWNDDFEYTTRLLRGRVGLYVPASRVLHATKEFGGSSFNPGPRFYNEVRNKVWMFGHSRSLSPIEKMLYGGRSLGRWAGLLFRSPERRELARTAVRAFRDGRIPPRTSVETLAGTPAESAARLVDSGVRDRR